EAARSLVAEIESGTAEKLEIANCKLQIANPADRDLTTDLRTSTPARTLEPDPSAILNLQSSISNLPSPGGAMPLGSPFYIERPVDGAFMAALARRDSIILLKGPRQVGKTSLLARGLSRARETGARVALTDLQKLTTEQLASADALFFTVAEMMAEELELETPVEELWNPRRGWNVNCERFLRTH